MASDNQQILFLEIFRSGNRLKMSVSREKEISRTVSHYSLCAVSFDDVSRICREITGILNSACSPTAVTCEPAGNLKKYGQLLWEQLLTRSVKNCLRSAPPLGLVLSLEEELVGIPWELLYDGNEFLGLKFNVGRLIRSQDEQAQPRYRNIPSRPRMLILANPTGDLKNAYEEGINIRNQFDKARDKIAIDFKSDNINTLYVRKSLREYDIVHFAGHCECDKASPRETGWLLGDGRFTAGDILSMSQDSFFPSLVFSNGCQSAQVNNDPAREDYQEKTYSLASAFLFSGVRHYIGAIRKIEDPASFVFAREFYTRLLKSFSVGESIRLARLRLVKEYGINSCFWAGYLLYGDPNFVLFLPKVKQQSDKLKGFADFPGKCKQKLFPVLTALGLAVVFSFLLFFLPCINPSSYYLFKKAQKLFKSGNNSRVIVLSEQIINKDPGFLEVYPLLADSYARKGKNDEALKYYFEYVLRSEKKGNPKHMACSYIMVGWFYQRSGFYPKAREFYQKAIEFTRQNQDKLNEALALRKLAVWHMDKEENDQALQLLTRSSEINREKKFLYDYKYNLACDYFDLGLLFANKDDYNTAKEFYNKSLKIFKDLNLNHEMSDYYFNLGEILVWEKQYQKALANYLQGIKIDEAQANLPSLASDYCMLGELYLDMDNFFKAEEYFKKAHSLAGEINARMELAEASYNLGILYKSKRRRNLAREYLRQAQEIYRTVDTPDYKSVQQELLTLDSPD